MITVSKNAVRIVFALLAVAYVASHFLTHAHASSLGIGTNEATLPSTGLFAHWMNWINVQQQQFYRSLTGALKAMRTDGSKMWLLVGLSFTYGIFHAAGPGHGKAVISSYMLANEVALRRGILLSFVSAFLQAFTAIAVMTLVFLVLRGTAISMDDATWFLEVVSYALISCFGAWVVENRPLLVGLFTGRRRAAFGSTCPRMGTATPMVTWPCLPHPRANTPARFARPARDHHSQITPRACGRAHAVVPCLAGRSSMHSPAIRTTTPTTAITGSHAEGEVCETCAIRTPDPPLAGEL